MSDRFAISPALPRRDVLRTAAGRVGGDGPAGNLASAAERKGRIKQSVCLWCYDGYMKQAQDGPRPVRRRLRQDGPASRSN